jgi:hypothetical protein
VKSFPALLSSVFRLLKPTGLVLIFETTALPLLFDGTTPPGSQAWHDAYTKSLRRGGMGVFDLEGVVGLLGGLIVKGDVVTIPVGHGVGGCPLSTP